MRTFFLENSSKELILGHGKLISVLLISAATPAINPQAQVTAARHTNTFIHARSTRIGTRWRNAHTRIICRVISPSHSFLPLSLCFKGREEKKKIEKSARLFVFATKYTTHRVHFFSEGEENHAGLERRKGKNSRTGEV